MRTIIALLALCLATALPAAAQQVSTRLVQAPSGTTYLVTEDFEGTGAPGGLWSALGSPNWDYATSPAPLVGSQSLYNSSTSNYGIITFAADQDDLNLFLYFIATDVAGSPYIVRFRDSSAAQLVDVRVLTTGAVRIISALDGTMATSSAGGTMMTHPDLKPGMPVYFAEVTGREKIVDIPGECTRWRVRHRDGEFSRIFLQFQDRIEQRVLEYVEPGILRPGFVKGVNVRKAA